jgi:hypothetical protein
MRVVKTNIVSKTWPMSFRQHERLRTLVAAREAGLTLPTA